MSSDGEDTRKVGDGESPGDTRGGGVYGGHGRV